MKTVVIIPTYNEKANIVPLVEKVFKTIPAIHVLVVDDSSPDGTADTVRVLQKQYPQLSLLVRKEKAGLGKAYINAFEHVLADSDVEFVVMMDADHSHDPMYLKAMLAQSTTHDVVIGSRYVKQGGTQGWEWWRMMLSRYGNRYCRLVTRMPVSDCTGGFNIIRADILRTIDFSAFDLSGYAFIMELKYRLHLAGARFAEVPIVFKNRFEGESKISSHIISEGIIAPWKMITRR